MQQHKRIKPAPGQESTWVYPRPPRLENSPKHFQVICNGVVIADTHRAKRILETSHPPVYYIPPGDVQLEQHFKPSSRSSFCEWKGKATYYTITVGNKTIADATWYYSSPTHPYEAIAGYIAIYPGKMDSCYVDGEKAKAQEGDLYGGWITDEIISHFKGRAGTLGW